MRKIAIPPLSSSDDPTQHTNLTFYRTIGQIPPTAHNLHACAHIYASDRNSIEIVGNALGWADEVGSIGSLSHSFVFHVPRDGLVMGEGEWFCQEIRTNRSGEGRGMYRSWIWKLGEGKEEDVHIASQWQEGMIRRVGQEGGKRQMDLWEEGMRRREEVKTGKGLGKGGGSKL